ncbi:MAG: glycosyltransferase family 39 protein [Pyrinomonadaceae bacterium]
MKNSSFNLPFRPGYSTKLADRVWENLKELPDKVLPPTTADIYPAKFADDLVFARDKRVVALILMVLLAAAFGFRVCGLGTESLGEDELNKLQTVEEYRANGLSGKNGEHPFLMKGLQTISIIGAGKINRSFLSSETKISDEAALRFPIALFGTFTVLLLFLLVSRMFGQTIGLVSAAFWAVEPMAIAFDRIAKEDSLVLFFLVLTFFFLVRGQAEAERENPGWRKYVYLAGASFAALMASKYYPFLLAIPVAYYNAFKWVPGRRWDLTKSGWLKFIVIMGVSFLIFNPTILLPDTWREMLKFSSENRIGHDSYEFMGALYRNQMSAWLAGVPWTFFFVFLGVKTSLLTLILFVAGLPAMLMRKLGDGRLLIFFWALVWLLSYTFVGGKFTRYFTIAAPLVFIPAAVGFYFIVKWLSERMPSVRVAAGLQIVLFVVVIAFPVTRSLSVSPHFRLYTNGIGGGVAGAGTYFPHDEFYDATTSDIVAEIAKTATSNAIVACETPALFEHYAKKAGRGDLRMISMSDAAEMQQVGAEDYVVAARGRKYFSNRAYLEVLVTSNSSSTMIYAGQIHSATIYRLDAATAERLRAIAGQ